MKVKKKIIIILIVLFTLFFLFAIFFQANRCANPPPAPTVKTTPLTAGSDPLPEDHPSVQKVLTPASVLPVTVGVGIARNHFLAQFFPKTKNALLVFPGFLKNSHRLTIIDFQGKIEGIFRHVYFRAGGDYGWSKKGKAKQLINRLIQQNMGIEGSFFDADAAIGLEMKIKKMALVPMIGYLYSYQKLVELQEELPLSNFAQENKFHWFGPFLGLNLALNPLKKWRFDLGYSYHFMQVRQAVQEQTSLSFPVSPYSLELHNEGKNGSGHRSMIGTKVLLTPSWILGLTARYQYFNSSREHAAAKEDSREEEQTALGYFSVQWWSFQTFLELAYEF